MDQNRDPKETDRPDGAPDQQPLSGIDPEWWNGLSSTPDGNSFEKADPEKNEDPTPEPESPSDGSKTESSSNNYYRPWNGGANGTKKGSEPGGQPPRVNLPPPPTVDSNGTSAKTLAIVSLVVSFVCCQFAGLIIAIVALVRANQSKRELGYLTSDASLARVLAIISIVLCVFLTVVGIVTSGLVYFIAATETAAIG